MTARLAILILPAVISLSAQTIPDEAYTALRRKDPERAADLFAQSLIHQPEHLTIRKDYAYTLLRLGESEMARNQFALVIEKDHHDIPALLEYGFLCHETGKVAEARRIFDQVRKSDPGPFQETAQRAFNSIDNALADAIEQWQEAVRKQPTADTVHEELARRAEERDDLQLAEKHYDEALRLNPAKERFFLDLGRIRHRLGMHKESLIAYVAASRSLDIRTAEQAREQFDPNQVTDEILYAAKNYLPTPVISPSLTRTEEGSALEMADRSFDRSYLKDALRYYESAYESDPKNGHILLRLGLTQNLLGRDNLAFEWLKKARKSDDPLTAAEANRAWRNLRPQHAPYRLTLWALPMYSSRWQSAFAYGQAKVELNRKWLFRPYLSLRFATDGGSGKAPGPLSERAVTPAIGAASRPWHGIVSWAEFGGNIGNTQGTDTRAGLAHVKGWGAQLNAEDPGFFHLMENGMNYASRFSNNIMMASQNRTGYTFGPWQIGLFYAASTDSRREYWANYFEFGPSLRTRLPKLPQNAFLSVEFVRGHNYVQTGNPRAADYFDLRIGLWYAFTH